MLSASLIENSSTKVYGEHMNRGERSTVLKVSLLLLIMTPIMISSISQVSADSSSSLCTNSELNKLIETKPIQMSQQTAIRAAESSSQYKAITADAASVNFSGIPNSWTIDRTSCTVSLEDRAVNFLMQIDNGSKYNVVVDVNPNTGVVDKTSVMPWFAASISVGSGTAYSGYEICASESCENDLQLYYVEAYYDQPTVSQIPSTYDSKTQPQCDESNGITCLLAVWAGLGNCDYTGQPTSCSYSSSGLVQAGTFAYVYSSSDIKYEDFDEAFEDNGDAGTYSCGDAPEPGDQIAVVVENEYLYDGSAGDGYYTFVTDNSADPIWTCSEVWTLNVSTAPYLADYIAERPQNYTSCEPDCEAKDQFTLPQFTSTTFSDSELYPVVPDEYEAAYTYYSAGDGYGVQMYNTYDGTNYQDTTTGTMSDSNDGTFTVGYTDSLGT
jgi:hypothetical protein